MRDIVKLADFDVAAIKYHSGSKAILRKELVTHHYQSLANTILDNDDRNDAPAMRSRLLIDGTRAP